MNYMNFPKMFQTKQVRQTFSCSLTYQKFPHQNQLVLSTASSFKPILNQESEYNWCKN